MKKNIYLKLEWSVIFAAHLGLLYWILFVLKNAGTQDFKQVALHFLGLSLYGGGLIAFCGNLYKRRFLKQNKMS